MTRHARVGDDKCGKAVLMNITFAGICMQLSHVGLQDQNTSDVDPCRHLSLRNAGTRNCVGQLKAALRTPSRVCMFPLSTPSEMSTCGCAQVSWRRAERFAGGQ
jgi:hypothetical protein